MDGVMRPQDEVIQVWTLADGEEYGEFPASDWTLEEALKHAAEGAGVPESELGWAIIRKNPELPRGSISTAAAKLLSADIGLRLQPAELEEFRRGLEVEAEHWGSVKGNWNTLAKIVADHLDEDPQYYDHLDIWKAYAHDIDLSDDD